MRALHPLHDAEITMRIVLRGELARQVIEIAERRRQEPVEMMASVVEIVIRDDMVDAVIDDDRGAA